MNAFGDVLQHCAPLHVPRVPGYDYVRDPQKAPGMDTSDLKCIEFRPLSFFQESNGRAANGSTAPGSPRRAPECATHKNEIPSVPSNLPVKIVPIEIRDGLPAGTESFSLHPHRIRNKGIGVRQNSSDFQMAKHFVNLQRVGLA